MGSLARCFAGGSMFLVVACASIAGIEDPEPGSPTGNTSSSSGSSGTNGTSSSGTSGTPGTVDPPGSSGSSGTPANDSGSEDAQQDAPPSPACAPPKKPNGESCASGADCCSNTCGQNRACVGSCDTTTCDGPLLASCCVGMYCGPTFFCRPCINSGEKAEQLFSTPNPRSCCSGKLDGDDCE